MKLAHIVVRNKYCIELLSTTDIKNVDRYYYSRKSLFIGYQQDDTTYIFFFIQRAANKQTVSQMIRCHLWTPATLAVFLMLCQPREVFVDLLFKTPHAIARREDFRMKGILHIRGWV